jgi:hypothetical protein
VKLPKFLLGDNTDFPEAIFIIHTEYPQFIINLATDEIEWLEEVQATSDIELANEINELIALASQFYDREMQRYAEE